MADNSMMGNVTQVEQYGKNLGQVQQQTREIFKKLQQQTTTKREVGDIAAFGAGNYGADKRIFGEGYNVGQGLAKAGQIGLTQIAKISMKLPRKWNSCHTMLLRWLRYTVKHRIKKFTNKAL